MRAEDLLAAYSLNSLRTIARVRGYGMAGARRPELVATLAERLFGRLELAAVLERLTPGEIAALEAVAGAGGRVARGELTHALLDRGVIDEPGTGRARESIDRVPPGTRRLDELCARLTAHGLLFSEPQTIGPTADPLDLSPGDVLFAPGPVLDLVRQRAERPHESRSGDPPDSGESSQPGGRLIAQPSYALLLLPPLDEPTVSRLSAIAEPVRVAETAEFRLTQAALYEAARRGESVAAIVAWLESRAGAPLPQNVRYSLDSWARSFEQVQVRRDAVLVEGPAEQIDRLLRDSQIAALALRRLDAERVLLRESATVARRVEELGEIVTHTRYGEGAPPRCRLLPDGTIAPESEDLLVRVALRRVAEPLQDGRWLLTPDRVREAAAATPDGITGVLKQLRELAGEIPAELSARLRLWALPPGAIRVEQPLLLRLPREVLHELRADAELGPLLADEYRPAGALVRIPDERRDHLLAALRARGILPDESSPDTM
jgi:hypothetical protein